MARNALAQEVDPPTGWQQLRLGAGEFYFIHYTDDPGTPCGIIHGCPCGCGGTSALHFRGLGRGRAEWDVVAGRWPTVTLSPSIGIRYDGDGQAMPDGHYHWHGYLREGWFEET